MNGLCLRFFILNKFPRREPLENCSTGGPEPGSRRGPDPGRERRDPGCGRGTARTWVRMAKKCSEGSRLGLRKAITWFGMLILLRMDRRAGLGARRART
jgi:hypothetical protein